IEMARGELIRFLDDDDYLLPRAATRQYEFMVRECLDFCSGGVSIRDEAEQDLGELNQPATESGVDAALSHNRLQIPFAHVYRRSTLGALRWPLGMKQTEDIVWLIRYAIEEPRRWRRMD